MTIEQRPFDLGEGVVYVAREVRDLDALPLHLQREVSPRMKAALESHLSSLDIEHVKFDSFVEWLHSIEQPTIELYDTAALPHGFGRAAFLRLGVALADLTSPISPLPIPESLRQIHGAVGGLQRQFGASQYLVPPGSIATLPERGFPRWWVEGADDELAQEAQSYLSFYEDSGTWFGVMPSSSRVLALGPEIGGIYGSTVEAILDRLFTSLLEDVWPDEHHLLGITRGKPRP